MVRLGLTSKYFLRSEKKWGPFVFRRSLRIINKKSWKIVKDHTQLRMIEIAYEKKVGAFCHLPSHADSIN